MKSIDFCAFYFCFSLVYLDHKLGLVLYACFASPPCLFLILVSGDPQNSFELEMFLSIVWIGKPWFRSIVVKKRVERLQKRNRLRLCSTGAGAVYWTVKYNDDIFFLL